MTPNRIKIHAFCNDALGYSDAVGLADRIRRKEISAAEAVAAAIARAQQVNPTLHAIVIDSFEQAMEMAKKQTDSPTGFFYGVPTFIKDTTNIAGLPTFHGTAALANAKVSKKTDPIGQQIFAQGFINLGKSAMPEFGFTCSTEFPGDRPDTCNPWNIAHTPGGSSGGAAALVAAGVVPLAHAADGGGSTRIPAACCGLIGLKPSRGRILQSDLFRKQAVDIAIDGVITRSVRDTAYFYAEAEKYYKNKKLDAIGLVEGASNRKLRIVCTSDSVSNYKADADTQKVLQDTAALLESMGHEVEWVKLPISDQFTTDFVNAWAMSAFLCRRMGWAGFGSHFNPKLLTNLTKGLSKHYGRNFLKTPFFISRLRRTYHEYTRLFDDFKCDLILTPTLSHSAPLHGYLGMDLDYEEIFPRMMNWACFTPYANASGAPSISLPMGHCATNDMPVGMLFWAKHGQEALLFDIAYQLEAAKPWRKITA